MKSLIKNSTSSSYPRENLPKSVQYQFFVQTEQANQIYKRLCF